jgi:hypothetical protein
MGRTYRTGRLHEKFTQSLIEKAEPLGKPKLARKDNITFDVKRNRL